MGLHPFYLHNNDEPNFSVTKTRWQEEGSHMYLQPKVKGCYLYLSVLYLYKNGKMFLQANPTVLQKLK